jgi:hypothetical protein
MRWAWDWLKGMWCVNTFGINEMYLNARLACNSGQNPFIVRPVETEPISADDWEIIV